MHEDWVVSLRDQCRESRVPFFFKQWGGVRKAKNGRLLNGRTYDEYPRRITSPIPEKASCLAYAREILSLFQPLVSAKSLIQVTA
jgi:hypothetical protein